VEEFILKEFVLIFILKFQAGLLKPDTVEDSDVEIPEFNVSYKPQKISPKFQSTVRHLLHQKIRDSYMHPQFVSDVMKPLQIEQLMDQEVVNLSGGELQRVALTLCLGKVRPFTLCGSVSLLEISHISICSNLSPSLFSLLLSTLLFLLSLFMGILDQDCLGEEAGG